MRECEGDREERDFNQLHSSLQHTKKSITLTTKSVHNLDRNM